MTDEAVDAFVHSLATDWTRAGLEEPERALCAYADKLTARPADVGDDDIVHLREHGFDDDAINDATQIIGYFNYVNRVADGLGIEQEDFVHAWEEETRRR